MTRLQAGAPWEPQGASQEKPGPELCLRRALPPGLRDQALKRGSLTLKVPDPSLSTFCPSLHLKK